MHYWHGNGTSGVDIVYSVQHIILSVLKKANYLHIQRECHMYICFVCASS